MAMRSWTRVLLAHSTRPTTSRRMLQRQYVFLHAWCYLFTNISQTTTQTSITGGGTWANGQVYTKQDQIPTTSVIWSPCGQTGILNVNNRIALTSSNATASGQISDDDATVAFTQQLHVSWQPCTK